MPLSFPTRGLNWLAFRSSLFLLVLLWGMASAHAGYWPTPGFTNQWKTVEGDQYAGIDVQLGYFASYNYGTDAVPMREIYIMVRNRYSFARSFTLQLTLRDGNSGPSAVMIFDKVPAGCTFGGPGKGTWTIARDITSIAVRFDDGKPGRGSSGSGGSTGGGTVYVPPQKVASEWKIPPTPANGATLYEGEVSLEWTRGVRVTGNRVFVSTGPGPGESYSYDSMVLTGGQTNMSVRVPTMGRQITATLVSYFDDNTNVSRTLIWNTYSQAVDMMQNPGRAVLTRPLPGATLIDSQVEFQWQATPGAGIVLGYRLVVGSSKGSAEYYSGEFPPTRNATWVTLPRNDSVIYARLTTHYLTATGATQDLNFETNYVGQGVRSNSARIYLPSPGIQLNSANTGFYWTLAGSAIQYILEIGSTEGGNDIFSRDVSMQSSVLVGNLPTDGRPLHVRLWTKFDRLSTGINLIWEYSDYVYYACDQGNPFRERAGLYLGTLRPAGATALAIRGGIQIVLTATGTFSIGVECDGQRYSATGSLDRQGHWSGSVTSGAGESIPLTLDLNLAEASGRLTGTLWTDGDGIAFSASRPGAADSETAKAMASRAGAYTVVLPPDFTNTDAKSPQGFGFGGATVYANGGILFAGMLADGTPISQGTYLQNGNEWIFYATPYPRGGSVVGKLTFRDLAKISDFDGRLAWTKSPVGGQPWYPEGFAINLDAMGSRYTAPTPGGKTLEFGTGAANARARFAGGATVAGTIPITLSAPGWATASVAEGQLGILGLPFSPTFYGGFVEKLSRKTRLFSGVVFQKQGRAFGTVAGDGVVGSIEVAPAVQLAVLVAPQTSYTSPVDTFQWTAGSGVTKYRLQIGSSAGASDIYNEVGVPAIFSGGRASRVVTTLPTDRRALYVTLGSEINGVWQNSAFVLKCQDPLVVSDTFSFAARGMGDGNALDGKAIEQPQVAGQKWQVVAADPNASEYRINFATNALAGEHVEMRGEIAGAGITTAFAPFIPRSMDRIISVEAVVDTDDDRPTDGIGIGLSPGTFRGADNMGLWVLLRGNGNVAGRIGGVNFGGVSFVAAGVAPAGRPHRVKLQLDRETHVLKAYLDGVEVNTTTLDSIPEIGTAYFTFFGGDSAGDRAGVDNFTVRSE